MVVTPDGCPVEAYAVLPAEPDLSVVLEHAVGRHRILDLGAGTGRIADPLAVAGYDVLAVDESAQMLQLIRHARTCLSRVEDLQLAERFDLILLLSHLVNTPSDKQRVALLNSAARHRAGDGLVLIQRHNPDRIPAAGVTRHGEVEITLADVDASRWPQLSAMTSYRVGDQKWDQPWQASVLDDQSITHALNTVGLSPIAMQGAWVTAA